MDCVQKDTGVWVLSWNGKVDESGRIYFSKLWQNTYSGRWGDDSVTKSACCTSMGRGGGAKFRSPAPMKKLIMAAKMYS